MGKQKHPALNRDENHLVNATIIADGTKINDVPCKIYLPERTHEKPYLVFKPSRVDGAKVMGAHKRGFRADVYGFDRNLSTTFEAPEIHFSGVYTKNWGADISESTLPGEPQDLFVIKYLNSREVPPITHLTVWLSPNKFLSPSAICSTSYTGKVKYDSRKIEFTIKDGLKLSFENHYRTKDVDGDLLQWSFLVACTELDIPAVNLKAVQERLLPDIDDFLLVTGFAARQRTACLGWTAVDDKTLTTFYRGNYSFPDGKNTDLNDCVIDIQSFEKYVAVCYPAFLEYDNKLALRNALYSTFSSGTKTIETVFLHLFAGLETLILDFRRRENLEFVMSPKVFAKFRDNLKGFISESTKATLEAHQRASIYKKLGELNRVSLQEAFELFCQKYEIDLFDLWPVFGDKKIAGLAEIRNRLIHGDPFPFELYDALVTARFHLEFVLERMLLRVLGWDISNSKVNPAYIERNYQMKNDLPSQQQSLKEYVLSQVAKN
ncbi:hypothetical protein [Geobacter sulfurreducens]|uniref:hypothetical protein n=1 Tax=Geobacter sulfurreducens TaxID=35554 RepID=UPI000DBB299B|nr:hypothetical protein [Geobacter sulfurreducens]BBA70608.1 hypothetical protein YM18_2089 [Geobacter sulfurreducens]